MLHNRELLLKSMDESGLDALIVCKPENAIYLTDFHVMGSRTIKDRLSYVVYFRDGNKDPVALCPLVDVRHMRDISWLPDENIVPFVEFQTGQDAGYVTDKFLFLAQTLSDCGLAKGRIGIEPKFINTLLMENFKKAFPQAELTEGEHAIQKAREIKTPEEIARLRKAAEVTEEGCLKLIEAAKQGATEFEAACKCRAASMSAGAETIGFSAIGAGPRSSMVHNNPRNIPVRQGEVFHYDYGALYDAYWGDLARSYVFGKKPSAEAEKLYETILTAQQAALDAVRPGATAGDVYRAAVEAGQKIDPTLRREHVGHGLGLEVHEHPYLIRDNESVLKPGMAVCVEVAKHVPEIGGFQVEDTVLVTESGKEFINHPEKMPKRLFLE